MSKYTAHFRFTAIPSFPARMAAVYLLALGCCLQLMGQSCTSATCNAATANEADVLAALPSPSNTNATVVVNIPAGSSTWTSQLSYSVPSAVTNLTIQGATTVNCTGTAGQSSWACPATDSTVITDGFTPNGQNQLIQITTGSSSSNFRWTGTTFKTAANTAKNNAMLVIQGNSHNVRLDHNHFNENGQNNSMIQVQGDTSGVADHNLFDLGGNSNVGNGFRNFASSDGVGDAAWNSATPWGTASFWYLESDVFNGGSPTDCYNGARLAVRYSTINNVFVMALHGTKNDAGRGRSCRATEIYHNYMSGSTNANAVIGQNGGTSMLWGNNIASGYNHFNAPGAPRNISGADSGTSPWDGGCGSVNGGPSYYDGNQTNGYPCLDGVGRGQGNLLSGTPATPHAWPSQKLEPEYMFMNTEAAADAGYINDISSLPNRDVYADCNGKTFDGVTCSSFNGTQGTGYGLLSLRPATCTAGPGGTYGASPTGSYGVGYWATDTNTFYVCTAANTWTAVYTPYVYPHPLVSGGTTCSLTVTVTNGNVTGTLCATNGAITAGTTIGPCSASANAGYTFTAWSGTGSASGVSGTSPVSFALNANSTLTATMTANSYTVTTSTAGSGSGTIIGCGGSTTFGASVSCTANVTSGTFTGWSGGTCTGTTNPCTFTMPAGNLTVTANFANGVAHPTFSPVAGSYGATQNVTIASTTAGATFCYTTDGSTPTTDGNGNCVHGAQYASPVSVATSLTIKAIGTKAGYTDSSVQSAAYVINGAVASVTFSPIAGSYASTQTVTLATTTAGSTICYTTDGSTPTTDGAGTCTHGSTYSVPFSVATTQTINAIGTKSGFSDSAVTSAAYTINGTLPTPVFAPAGGSYGAAQTVTISVTGGSSVSLVNAMQETANGADLIGSTVHRNTYTNCIATCASGSPAPSPFGTLWCTAAIKSSSTIGSVKCPAYASNGVVSSTISGGGTSALDNGNGAGGSDSPNSLTATYAGASTGGCGTHSAVTSGYVSGLTFPDPGANALLTMGITTGSPGNSSILTVSKYNSNGDTGRYVAQRDCVNVNSITVGGQHYESDYNYNTTGGTYLGFGKDFDYPNKHWRVAPQGSSWIVEELCPVAGGACVTTYNWPLADYLAIESYEHWDAGCSYSSGSACAFYDAIGIQPYSGGVPTGPMVYYTVRNSSTHAQIGFIPINKTSWTHPQYAIQHQWDINQSSKTLTANIDYSTAVAYFPITGSATICYTTDGTTPTADGAGTCTHGTTYSGAITVSATTTIKAIASQSGFLDSAVGSAAYTINGVVATPSYSPVAGTYASTQSVTISTATVGAAICYTTDGTTPTADGNGTCTHGTTYSTPISIAVTQTLKAIGTLTGYTDSAVQSGAYVITGVAAPTITGTVTISGSVPIQ